MEKISKQEARKIIKRELDSCDAEDLQSILNILSFHGYEIWED